MDGKLINYNLSKLSNTNQAKKRLKYSQNSLSSETTLKFKLTLWLAQKGIFNVTFKKVLAPSEHSALCALLSGS